MLCNGFSWRMVGKITSSFLKYVFYFSIKNSFKDYKVKKNTMKLISYKFWVLNNSILVLGECQNPGCIEKITVFSKKITNQRVYSTV
mgnify:CR=1 FL=1